MNSLVRTKSSLSNASLAWIVLCALTIGAWALGTSHGFGGIHVPASLAILAVAIFKVRLVGLYFMELTTAPRVLRGVFEGYCVAMLGFLTSMYLFG